MRRLLVVAVAFAAACSEASAPSLLDPPPSGQGVQYRMLTRVDPGAEVEHCQFFQVPPGGLNVTSTETRFTAGSHHVLMYLTAYTQIPTANDRGVPVDTSRVFDCTSGAFDGWSVTTMVGGSQNGSGQSPVQFPTGVAMPLPAGAVLMMNAHYINASTRLLEPEVRMNFRSIPSSEVRIEGGILFWYDIFIRVEAEGRGLAKMFCTVPADITLVAAQSHMHRRGVGFGAEATLPDGSQLPLYQTDAWENVPTQIWPGGLPIATGTRIEFFCDYENPEARTVWMGPRSSDEMCVFAAAYYPARPHISYCASDPAAAIDTQFLGANWVGNGTATCNQTLDCLQAIDRSRAFEGITSCVLAAAPSESERVSAVARCVLTHDRPETECLREIIACQNP